MSKRFVLDLQLKVTEPFKGQKFEILSSLLPEKVTSKGNLGKCRFISVALRVVSQSPFEKKGNYLKNAKIIVTDNYRNHNRYKLPEIGKSCLLLWTNIATYFSRVRCKVF